jgi:osmoprotectant transport system permease protein
MSSELLHEILQRSGEHLLLVALAVGLALAIALPLGVLIQERPRLARLVLGTASVVQTIPNLLIQLCRR